MSLHQKMPLQKLERSLITFFGLLILSLLIVFAVEPSIYTTMLSPVLTTTERYPLPAILFLLAIVAFVSILMYGITQHWRWLFWPLLVAFTGSVIQVPVEILQLTGVLPISSPVWYGLFRAGVGIIEIGFAFWMIQVYRCCGVWAMGRKR